MEANQFMYSRGVNNVAELGEGGIGIFVQKASVISWIHSSHFGTQLSLDLF